MIELCYHYTTTGYPTFKPRCKLRLWASLKCHSRYCKCPRYSATGGHTRGHTISMLVLDEFADYPSSDIDWKQTSPDLPK